MVPSWKALDGSLAVGLAPGDLVGGVGTAAVDAVVVGDVVVALGASQLLSAGNSLDTASGAVVVELAPAANRAFKLAVLLRSRSMMLLSLLP